MKKFIKENKLLSILLLITIISFIAGILFHATLKEEEFNIITNNINDLLKNHNETILNNIINTNITTITLWLLGISIIGVLLILILYILKVFIFSFELISFITTLKIKKIGFILFYFLPKTFNILLLFILSYFSIEYSINLFKYLFMHKNINFNKSTKKYVKILLINIVLNISISLINYYIVLKLLKINI